MSKLVMTQKAIDAGYTSLQVFLDADWTPEQLIEQGWALAPENPTPVQAAAATPPIVAPLSAHGERQPETLGPAVANIFGITDLSTVTRAFREYAGPMRGRYPHKWSYEQQILYAAELLVRQHADAIKGALS